MEGEDIVLPPYYDYQLVNGSFTIVEEKPYSVTATPLAATENNAFFELTTTSNNNIFGTYNHVIAINTVDPVKIKRIFAMPEDDIHNEILSSIIIGTATESVPFSGPLVDIAQKFQEYKLDQTRRDVSSAQIYTSYSDENVKYLIWLESSVPIANWGSMPLEYANQEFPPHTSIVYSYSKTDESTHEEFPVILLFLDDCLFGQ